jgi:putative membrane protein
MTPILASILASGHWHQGGWFPWFPFVPLFFLGLWILLFGFVFRRRWRGGGPDAQGVLAERYARGEIDEREYLERRAVLRRKD